MAARTRVTPLSMRPNSSDPVSGAPPGMLPECSFMATLAPCGGSCRNRLHNLWGQSEANVFRHHFNLFDVSETLVAENLHNFLYQYFRRRRSRGERDGLHVDKPVG